MDVDQLVDAMAWRLANRFAGTFGMTIALAVAGCSDPQQAKLDDAYHRGDISSAQYRAVNNRTADANMAGLEAERKQFDQQPQGKLAEKMVFPQPVDDDGR